LSLSLYCICATWTLQRHAPPPPAEVALPLRWLQTEDLAALVSPAPLQDDVAAMLAFGEVIAHYHARLTVVPMRFGSRLSGPDAVMAHLAADHDRYAALLRLLDDCVEMGLRLPLGPTGDAADEPPSAVTGALSGRDYLLRRRAELAASADGDAALDRLDAWLAGLFRRRRREQGWFAGQRRLSTQYLVPRPRLAAFELRLADALAAGWLPGAPAGALTSGPWPPYSFATADPAGAVAEIPSP
jgi:hypothetical protein